jgi:hypothetical protein
MDASGAAGVPGELSKVLDSARAGFANLLRLASLEARRASLALLWMLVLGLLTVVLLAAAWAGLMAVLVLWAMSVGAPALGAAVIVAAANLLAALLLIRGCVGLSRDLLFTATLRQVRGGAVVASAAP